MPQNLSPTITRPTGLKYQQVTASNAGQALGSGAVNNLLAMLTIIPGTTSPGAVQIKDGTNAAITVFTGGATSVASLAPFTITLNAASVVGGWSVITGANVTALATGNW